MTVTANDKGGALKIIIVVNSGIVSRSSGCCASSADVDC